MFEEGLLANINSCQCHAIIMLMQCVVYGSRVCFLSVLQKVLCNLAHLMGASVRKDITGSVTHVVAHSVSGSRYKVTCCVMSTHL